MAEESFDVEGLDAVFVLVPGVADVVTTSNDCVAIVQAPRIYPEERDPFIMVKVPIDGQGSVGFGLAELEQPAVMNGIESAVGETAVAR